MTRRYALLGTPLAHSVSPSMYRAVFEHWGVCAEYEPIEVTADVVGATMNDLRLAGGNVTLPHKLVAAGALAAPSVEVRATGACNCWWRLEDGGLAGDNTDVDGFRFALERMDVCPEGARVLVLGAGGGARAVVRSLSTRGAAEIDVHNRTPETARRLCDESVDGLARAVTRASGRGRYDLVVNATSVGLRHDDPLPLELLAGRFGAAFDLVYGAGETAWVTHARAIGIPAADGLEMLVGQAAAGLHHWFPNRAPPHSVLRLEALRAVGREVEQGGRGR